MIWLTNKWAQIGALIVAFVAWLAVHDRKIARDIRLKNEAKDNEKANYVRRRVDAIRELHDSDIKYRD